MSPRNGASDTIRRPLYAIDRCLAEQEGDDLDAVLALRGSLTAEEAGEMERLIAGAWSTWPASS